MAADAYGVPFLDLNSVTVAQRVCWQRRRGVVMIVMEAVNGRSDNKRWKQFDGSRVARVRYVEFVHFGSS